MRLVVSVFLIPAYDEFVKFAFNRQEFENVARSISPLLKKRQKTIAGAWWLGYRGDWRMAATILVPQIEFLVSQVLEKKGVKVTYTHQGGMTETYMALSTLLELPEAKECLGETLWKELELLFGAAPHLNLRNNMMHGLIDDPGEGYYCPCDLYIWWMSMRLLLVEEVFFDAENAG